MQWLHMFVSDEDWLDRRVFSNDLQLILAGLHNNRTSHTTF
jgi:hypothetical protein